jgi:poly(hydroxyalkanoate) depolymerase family esterase
MGISTAALLQATRLTRQGRLMDATRAIQRALGFGAAAPAGRDAGAANDHAPADVMARDRLPAAHPAGPVDVVDVEFRDLPPLPAGIEHPATPRRPGKSASFTAHVFAFGGHRYRYRLYEPERPDPGALLPVVVMLHGCKQDSEDFARGTGMNEVAAREGFLVLYPEQLRKANGMGCWNWFEPGHQQRGAGEPGMIAALVQATVAAHGGDPRRVYVAGLSAGGAMAASLGELYPDLFAAVGVHSGLPPGAAHDVPSAFSAMRKGAAAAARAPATSTVPTIVFHGSGDRTVTPANADAVVRRQLAAHHANGAILEHGEQRKPGSKELGVRAATLERWSDASGQVVLESWRVSSGPHAWSGGRPAGSFTDPQGPSASEAMARFFLQHRKK